MLALRRRQLLNRPLVYPGALWALNFARGIGERDGIAYAGPAKVPGWAYSRTGIETDRATGLQQFASGVPAIVPGLGLQHYPARTNSYANPLAPATQSISLATGTYVVVHKGPGSSTSSVGTATGTGFGVATDGSPNVFTLTGAGSVTITKAGSPTAVNVQLGATETPIIPIAGVRGASSASMGAWPKGEGTLVIFTRSVTPPASVGVTIFGARVDVNNEHSLSYRAQAGGANYTQNTVIGSSRTFSPADVGTPTYTDKIVYTWGPGGGDFVANGASVGTSSTDMSGLNPSSVFLGSAADVTGQTEGYTALAVAYPRRMSLARALAISSGAP